MGMSDSEAVGALIKVVGQMTDRIDALEKDAYEHISRLQSQANKAHAEFFAMKMVLACILEQVPLDKAAFQEAATRHYDAVVETLEKGGMPEQGQKLHRERLDRLVELLLRVI